ncbi:MAG: Glutathione S-transferase, omega [Labilithrix sp.]|nr:Glutathione S-transferase, omega [Labilithrix sp.]
MGELVDGTWHKGWYDPDQKGAFQRPATRFRHRITQDGSSGFATEAGRYHLYVSHACPWAHRTMITRALRGLEDAVSVTVVGPDMGDDGWPFTPERPDPLGPSSFLRDVYVRADAHYTGRVTVPVLWDKQRATIVNNESREVMRMLDTELEAFATGGPTLYPAALRAKIDETLDALYAPINNGVYRAGFATKQEAYDEAVRELFAALDHWDEVLAGQRYLCGATLTEADVAFFTTLVRFDLVYHGHFKCNVRRIQEYPHLWGYLRDIYQTPGVAETCHLGEMKRHYYWSQSSVNPTRIVPAGPHVPLGEPHDRAGLQAT